MNFNFYYDESEHSRKITYSTVTGETYYDNFITAIVGWSSDKEEEIACKYSKFENKYADRKKRGELKSDTFKQNQFEYGFASFNKQNVELLNDFLSIIDNEFYIYFSVASKIEFAILQIFRNYHNDYIFDMDALKYSIIKAILTYRPEEIINSVFNSPNELVDRLKIFFLKRIEINQQNIKLKSKENEAFNIILLVLNDIEPIMSVEWDYHMAFVGFDKFLKNQNINQYTLTLDKEGEINEISHTLTAAREIGFINAVEKDSKLHFGLRIADMLAGIVGKIMKSLYHALRKDEDDGGPKKILLEKEWFCLTEEQLTLYKQLHRVVFKINDDWYKIYSGLYSDDLVSFLAILEFMNHFKNIDEIRKDIEMQPEYCNGCMCDMLADRFERMKNKLPFEFTIPKTEEYFRNHQGAKWLL